MSPKEFTERISSIIGDDISDGEINLRYSWNNYEQAKALLLRIRTVQKELRLLKQEVTATISAARSEFTTARTAVGKSAGAGIAAGFFGRPGTVRSHSHGIFSRHIIYPRLNDKVSRFTFECGQRA